MPYHPESADGKQKLETAFLGVGGHPDVPVIDRRAEARDSCRNCTVEVRFPGAGTIY